MKINENKIGPIACYSQETDNPAGPVILWIHGYTLNAEIWPGIWELYPEACHIAAELPGHGKSDPLSEFNSLQELAAHFVSIAENYNVSHIIGFSFGGIVALQMVLQQPGKFKSLFLISSAIGGSLIDEDAMIRNQKLIKLFAARGKGEWLTELWLESPPHIFTGLKKYEDKFRVIKKIIEKHEWKELSGNTFSLFTATNQLTPALQQVLSTVFIYLGEEDMPHIKRSNEFLFRKLKKVRRVYFNSCGHLPLLEQPLLLIDQIKAAINELETINEKDACKNNDQQL